MGKGSYLQNIFSFNIVGFFLTKKKKHFKLPCWLASNKPITEADICGMKAFNLFHMIK